VNLTHLGWNSFYSRAFEPYRRSGCRAGRVAMAHPGLYRVLTESGELDAPAVGRLLHEDTNPPLVGDWVALRLGAAIEAVLPRRTVLARKQPGSTFGRQPLAANLDMLLIVTGLDGDFSPRRIERYLVLAEHSGIEPLLVLSKADLLDEPARRRALDTVRSLSPQTPVVLWSAYDPSGIEALDGAVGRGRTAALIGSSGVGKSTMVNCLLGYEALATRPVRESDSRGRHTTSRRQLIPLPQGWILIDMPGLREVQLWAEESAVESVFADIEALARSCRFRNCTHTAEPDCAVLTAVAEGGLDAARLAQFHQLRREAAYVEAQQDTSALLARKRREKAFQCTVNRLLRELPKLR
jgi:ribosome biogenesis GTPase